MFSGKGSQESTKKRVLKGQVILVNAWANFFEAMLTLLVLEF
jgi:hypothetical protein